MRQDIKLRSCDSARSFSPWPAGKPLTFEVNLLDDGVSGRHQEAAQYRHDILKLRAAALQPRQRQLEIYMATTRNMHGGYQFFFSDNYILLDDN